MRGFNIYGLYFPPICMYVCMFVTVRPYVRIDRLLAKRLVLTTCNIYGNLERKSERERDRGLLVVGIDFRGRGREVRLA